MQEASNHIRSAASTRRWKGREKTQLDFKRFSEVIMADFCFCFFRLTTTTECICQYQKRIALDYSIVTAFFYIETFPLCVSLHLTVGSVIVPQQS